MGMKQQQRVRSDMVAEDGDEVMLELDALLLREPLQVVCPLSRCSCRIHMRKNKGFRPERQLGGRSAQRESEREHTCWTGRSGQMKVITAHQHHLSHSHHSHSRCSSSCEVALLQRGLVMLPLEVASGMLRRRCCQTETKGVYDDHRRIH